MESSWRVSVCRDGWCVVSSSVKTRLEDWRCGVYNFKSRWRERGEDPEKRNIVLVGTVTLSRPTIIWDLAETSVSIICYLSSHLPPFLSKRHTYTHKNLIVLFVTFTLKSSCFRIGCPLKFTKILYGFLRLTNVFLVTYCCNGDFPERQTLFFFIVFDRMWVFRLSTFPTTLVWPYTLRNWV